MLIPIIDASFELTGVEEKKLIRDVFSHHKLGASQQEQLGIDQKIALIPQVHFDQISGESRAKSHHVQSKRPFELPLERSKQRPKD